MFKRRRFQLILNTVRLEKNPYPAPCLKFKGVVCQAKKAKLFKYSIKI